MYTEQNCHLSSAEVNYQLADIVSLFWNGFVWAKIWSLTQILFFICF